MELEASEASEASGLLQSACFTSELYHDWKALNIEFQHQLSYRFLSVKSAEFERKQMRLLHL